MWLSEGRAVRWLALTLVFLPFACVSSEKSTKSKYDLTAEEQKKLEEYRAEVEVGRNMAGRLLAYYGSVGDDGLLGYVNQVGNYVAGYGDYPDRRYMFAILDSDQINAFACPGGYILINRGTLKAARTEAELAAILAHEVTHVGKQHMLDTLKSMNRKQLDKHAKAAEEAGEKDPALKMRERPDPEGTGAGKVLARYLSGSSGAGFSVLKAATAGMDLILEKGLDKELEFEADREGVKYAIRAGYQPDAMMKFLSRARRINKSKGGKLKKLSKTHPSISARKKNIAKLLESLNAEDIIGASGVRRYKRFRKRLSGAES